MQYRDPYRKIQQMSPQLPRQSLGTMSTWWSIKLQWSYWLKKPEITDWRVLESEVKTLRRGTKRLCVRVTLRPWTRTGEERWRLSSISNSRLLKHAYIMRLLQKSTNIRVHGASCWGTHQDVRRVMWRKGGGTPGEGMESPWPFPHTMPCAYLPFGCSEVISFINALL